MGKRTRACEECHRLKIKCDVGNPFALNDDASTDSINDNGSSKRACERCIRNNIQCVPTAPRLQRDRISELNAQVEQLKSELLLLRGQNRNSSASSSNSARSADFYHGRNVLSFLDARIPHALQQDLLRFFVLEVAPQWPIILLPTDDLDHARREYPILLLSILTYTVTRSGQSTSQEVHDDLIHEVMHVVGDDIMVRGQQSLELVQTLLVAGFWNKSARGESHASCFQLTQIATDMAIDLNIAGPCLRPTPSAYFRPQDNPTSTDARRTWLACFLCMAAASVSNRRPIAVPWNSYHHECLLHLESIGNPSDILLCQLVRVSVLTQEVSTALKTCDLTVFMDGNTYSTHAIMDDLRMRAGNCAAQVMNITPSPGMLKILWHVAMIYIHEPLFWTPTNMASFASPFIPGRIAVHDFAHPEHPIPPLEASLPAIIQHCHAVIDIAHSELSPMTIVHLPSFCTAPLITYSMYMLMCVLVSATGQPSGVYGRYITREMLAVDKYLLKLRDLVGRLKVVDPMMSCYTTRILDATGWLEQWYNDYAGILQRYESNMSG
ncbi:uncharacterized protein B0I36DRAFT_278131 [Microdochium trichocladiopsis]|uniref:Zn(2)-C6 fungal-type domain-containing protein n=1 Tax=Microdochium trichocladiopsis TaxID=1682393 RepID=A0A9P8XRP4_9PEZI|nr:uncharacterized protein B0I36DRAFT_278131 [Microdochium trichocladiopsis]KAH7014255.1 hypothetical protein B0I36DRAFT_278131 [Microdochium trichocladiopsis]